MRTRRTILKPQTTGTALARRHLHYLATLTKVSKMMKMTKPLLLSQRLALTVKVVMMTSAWNLSVPL